MPVRESFANATKLKDEISEKLTDRGLEVGELQPATRDIYYNQNLTDGSLFIKLNRNDYNHWFDFEITESIIARKLLKETELGIPRLVVADPINLSTGQHFSVWEFVEAGKKDEANAKIDKLLNTVRIVADHTQERLAEQGAQRLPFYSWRLTVEKAYKRMRLAPNPEILMNINRASEYVEQNETPVMWIHGDLHGANMIEGTNYVVDWASAQFSFLEWDLAHIVKEPFHYIDHDNWGDGLENLDTTITKIQEMFPSANLELIRQCVIIRRSAAILWKREAGEFNLDRWYHTLNWFKDNQL